ncbi:hypothetical protein MRB53_014434 [Persea americana]|uniref:Uncharacterized protein n=1 Tax=Persea americana TaxID=3435 RepID=A0ACC2KAU3_PERAE|nr:hypothetical protein MRB53_014434 [Persea americana]
MGKVEVVEIVEWRRRRPEPTTRRCGSSEVRRPRPTSRSSPSRSAKALAKAALLNLPAAATLCLLHRFRLW